MVDIADLGEGKSQYLSVGYEAAWPSQLSRACWLYAMFVRKMVVAFRVSCHVIGRTR